MNFEPIENETVILDLNNDIKRKTIQNEIRKDSAHLPFYTLKEKLNEAKGYMTQKGGKSLWNSKRF